MGTPEDVSWNFSGIGDLELQTNYAFYKPSERHLPTVFGTFALELPTGRKTVLNSDGEEADSGITPGSSSYDTTWGVRTLQHLSVPTLGSDYALMPIYTGFSYRINGKGREDYRLGNQFHLRAGGVYPVLSWLGIIQQFDYLDHARDHAGDTHEEVEKTGGEFLYYAPGVQFRLGDHWEWATLIQIPLYRRVNAIQLTSPYNLNTSLSYRFTF
jgi:hypothetical protein